ncbi:hypothetical protein H6S28_20015 [Escherichia coli]|nr:hypothetical protein H6S28_20015 [Escherichia coli]
MQQALNYCDAFEYATSNALDKMTISMVGGKPAGKHARVLENGELIDMAGHQRRQLNPYYADLMAVNCVWLPNGRSQTVTD